MYAWLIEGVDKEGREKIDEVIFGIPKNIAAQMTKEEFQEANPEWSNEEMANSFMALAARRGVLPQNPQ